MGDSEIQSQVYQAMQAQNWLMNNFGLYVTGKNEQLDSKTYSFSGIAQVMEVFMYDIAGAAEMPFTKLFGRSPAGLNSTGESDLQNYYDSISQKQSAYLSPVLDKLLPIIAISEWGYVPDDFDYDYDQIGSLSNKDKSELADKGSEAIGKAYDRGLISAKIALKELRQQSDTTGYFSNITDADIANANDKPERMDEMMPDLPLGVDAAMLMGDAEWNEADHPRQDDGKFGNGSGNSNAQTSNHIVNAAPPSATGANKFTKGFNPHNLKEHTKKHRIQYPDLTDEEYNALALDLVQRPVGGCIRGYLNKSGQVIRYDEKNNDFVKGRPHQGIATMFKPERGLQYYLFQERENK